MRLTVLSLWVGLVLSSCAKAPAIDIVSGVRDAVGQKDFAAGQRAIETYRAANGVTPAMLDADSQLAAGAFAAKQVGVAERQARETYDLARTALERRRVDDEPQLPIALARAIEVMALVSVESGARSDAIGFLERELATYKSTSVEKRIQKNINLLTLEGTVAPALDLSEHIGVDPPPLAALKGKVVLMFFWAHWCSDCKAQGPILAALVDKYQKQGLTLVAPTQRFGYVAGGEPAPADVENPYIVSVQQTYYPGLAGRPIPLSEANHRRYGVSSTPTLVLVDRRGVIRLYHPGRMTEQELDPILRRLLDEPA